MNSVLWQVFGPLDLFLHKKKICLQIIQVFAVCKYSQTS